MSQATRLVPHAIHFSRDILKRRSILRNSFGYSWAVPRALFLGGLDGLPIPQRRAINKPYRVFITLDIFWFRDDNVRRDADSN